MKKINRQGKNHIAESNVKLTSKEIKVLNSFKTNLTNNIIAMQKEITKTKAAVRFIDKSLTISNPDKKLEFLNKAIYVYEKK